MYNLNTSHHFGHGKGLVNTKKSKEHMKGDTWIVPAVY